jgi:hypothetical protein
LTVLVGGWMDGWEWRPVLRDCKSSLTCYLWSPSKKKWKKSWLRCANCYSIFLGWGCTNFMNVNFISLFFFKFRFTVFVSNFLGLGCSNFMISNSFYLNFLFRSRPFLVIVLPITIFKVFFSLFLQFNLTIL